MNLLRVDHTAIVVRDMDTALARYAHLYGLSPSQRATAQDQGVEVAFLPIGDTQLELIQPLDSTSGVARYLAKHGEGLHHIGILVQDIHQELQRLAEEGVELIDREPRRGIHGLIAFVHPRSSGGVLIELVQPQA
jgi:methylmalonyl-CoA epimerase